MAFEKRWGRIPTLLLTSDGTVDGCLTVDDNCDFKVKMIVGLGGDSLESLRLEVKEVQDDGVTVCVGPLKGRIDARTDISAYTVAANSFISSEEQSRSKVPEQEVERITYEEEPTVARRVIQVDKYGNKYTTENPFPVQLSDGSVNIGTVNAELEVQLSHQDDSPDLGDVHDSVRIGGGLYETEVDADNNLHVEMHGDAPDGTDNVVQLTGIEETNSTTVPLGSGGIFTGTWHDVSSYSNLTVMVNSDQDSAVNGFIIEHSIDGVGVDRRENFSVLASDINNSVFTTYLPGRYVRIRYINGATPQGVFRLISKLHMFQPKASTSRVTDNIPNESDVESVKNVEFGLNPNNEISIKKITGVDDSNSTTTPLAADGEFTGDWKNVEGWADISVVIRADQDSAVDGLIIEFSTDGVNVVADDRYSIAANTGEQISVGITCRYYRVRFVNGPVVQSAFQLQSMLHSVRSKPSSHRISETLDGENDVELVKSILSGIREDGSYSNVELSNQNSIKVAIADRPSQVLNRVPVYIPVDRVTLSGTPTSIYTVTSGYTLYIQSFLISALNTSTADGEFRLRDDTTERIPFLIPSRVTGSSPSAFSVTAPALIEPIPFSVDVNFIEITGNLEIAGFIIGYEEPNP